MWRRLLALTGFLLIAASLWAQRSVNPPEPVTSWDGQKASYRAFKSFTCVAGDIAVLPGSATKTIRVTRAEFSTTSSGTAAGATLAYIKRSTADTSGTSAAMTAVPLDANDAAASAAPLSYTAAPTLGTAVGTLESFGVWEGAAAGTNPPTQYTYAFGQDVATRAVVLRGTAQQLAVNLSAVVTTETCSVLFQWTEE